VLLKSLSEKKGSCFYLGSSEYVLSRIRERAFKEYPSVKTCTYSPPYNNEFSREETMAMIGAVNDFAPDVLFVGMTAPKQEKWVYENRHLINAPVICSIGAVFDFYAGTVKRPGKFWISLGLEWLPRLLREPGKLWRRTLISAPLFLWIVLREKFRMLNLNAQRSGLRHEGGRKGDEEGVRGCRVNCKKENCLYP
jgi:N-acetylglucosaminyldiphosphoundecaprenol N-acetyl-beta-D-mannosaminyltransferase